MGTRCFQGQPRHNWFWKTWKIDKKIALGFKMNVITVDKNDKKYFAKNSKKYWIIVI